MDPLPACIGDCDGRGEVSVDELRAGPAQRKCLDTLDSIATPCSASALTEEQVARINRKLEGWSNYFRLGPVSS